MTQTLAATLSEWEMSRLQSSIGAVAMASARMEETLSRILAYLAGSEEAWIIFTGRPPRSAIDQSLAIIAERTNWVRDGDEREAIKNVVRLLKLAAELLEYRNGVVHALWSTEPVDESPAMPWHDAGSTEMLLYPARSRINKGPTERKVTITDVQTLASRIDDADRELYVALAKSDYLAGGFAAKPTDISWYL